jgi:hypothetical protein
VIDGTKAIEPLQQSTASSVARRRCGARTKSGKPCPTPPIKGGTRCRMHGGAAPQVKKAARERLMELREPALVALGKVLRDPKADDATKVRAAVAILDRTGLGPNVKVEVEQLKPWQVLMATALGGAPGVELPEGVDLEAIEANELRSKVRALEAEIDRLRAGRVVVDVEPIDDDEPIDDELASRRELRAVAAVPEPARPVGHTRVHDAMPARREGQVPECLCWMNEGRCKIHRPKSAKRR